MCVALHEITMLWDANGHHGVARYQSIATLGVATESTGVSFIYLDESRSGVDQSGLFSDFNRNSIAVAKEAVPVRARPRVPKNLLVYRSLHSSNDANPPICSDPSKKACGQQSLQL